MSKLYLQHDYQVTGRDYVDTEGGDTPAGGISYSTEEQDTGLTWIDGKKVYQITIEQHVDTPTAGQFVTTGILVSSINAAAFLSGQAYDSQGQTYPCTVVFMNSGTEIGIALAVSTRSLFGFTFTYTKTE